MKYEMTSWEMALIALVVVVFTLWFGDFMEKGLTKLRESINQERKAAREKFTSNKDEHEDFPGI